MSKELIVEDTNKDLVVKDANYSINMVNQILNKKKMVVKNNISTDQNKIIEFEDNIQAWIDTNTGLMWEIKTLENFNDLYSWGENTENYPDYIEHAYDYIKKLNTKSYAGFNDWRIPRIREFETLVVEKEKLEYCLKDPLANSCNVINDWGKYYLSATIIDNENKKNRLSIELFSGEVFQEDKECVLYVLCVRNAK
ncbi:MAG: DUF1566 domain-containing protein [Helicobacteraceae bacterium]|nr:DUF1566 domain-containing protein [Helicobacteraceae bacterium]